VVVVEPVPKPIRFATASFAFGSPVPFQPGLRSLSQKPVPPDQVDADAVCAPKPQLKTTAIVNAARRDNVFALVGAS